MRRVFGRDYLYNKPYMAFAQGLLDAVGFFIRRPGKRRLDKAGVRRILVSRIDHLGDVFIASSVLSYLKKAFPDAKIDFLAGVGTHVYLKTNPHIERIIPYNAFRHNRTHGFFKRLTQAASGYLRVMLEMRAAGYDLSLNLRSYPFNATTLLYLGGCGYNVGFATGGYGFLLDSIIPYREGGHETEHLVAALEVIGIDANGLRPYFEPSVEASVRAVAILNDLGVTEGERFALIHTGAGTDVKHWKQEAWAQTAASLRKEYGLKVLVTDPVYGGIDGCNVLPALVSFEEYGAIVKRAALFAGLDSFPAHLAASMDIPTVVIWCGVNDSTRWRPLGPSVAVVRKKIDCAPCFKKAGCVAMTCMNIGARECIEAVDALLKK